MLRSFDYAAHAVEADVQAELDDGAQIAYRANEWAARNQQAFLTGYLTAIRPDAPRDEEQPPALTPDEQVLLTAYQADKAVYETVYEARNRPSWIGIPLGAIARLTEPPAQEEQP
jgi:maltokinase